MMPFAKRRFRLSDKAPRSKNKRLTGRVVGETKDGACWRIIFDGTVTTQTFHKSFVKISHQQNGDKDAR